MIGLVAFLVFVLAVIVLAALARTLDELKHIWIEVRSISTAFGRIFDQVREIRKELKKIIMTQEEFDAKIDAANTSLDAIGGAIEAERQQIADFIASQPAGIDTSSLNGVVDRLGGISASVSGIFTPPAVEEAPPVDEPPVETPPEG